MTAHGGREEPDPERRLAERAARIRSDSPTSKVVISSGSASPTAVLAARRAGCAG